MKNKPMRPFAVLLLVSILAPSLADADTVEAVTRRVLDKWREHKTMRARFVTEEHMGYGSGAVNQRITGTHESLRQGDKVLARIETMRQSLKRTEDDKLPPATPSLTILDGEYTYTLRTVDGKPRVTKTSYDAAQAGDPGELLARLAKDFQMSVEPDEKLDEQPMWVFEAERQAEFIPAGFAKRIRLWFDQRSGVLVKMVIYDVEGTSIRTMRLTEIELDVDLSPKRFEFVAPPNAEVVDRTTQAP